MKYNKKKYPILTKIDTPAELRKLPQETLITLSHELRQFLLDTISQSSGHFASGLGAIELTIALHYVYDTPFDSLIWDVGHQAYPHKILTGRRDTIFSIRKKDGLHPFPYRDESQYDVLSVGHSSTSISAGLGMAVAAKKEMLGRRTICVIGDGAITAGIAFEAMNHAGRGGYDILVILNDNKMSISKNVGALNKHLKQIVSKKCSSNSFENNKKIFFHHLPIIQSFLKHTEKYIKKIIRPNSLFEKMGFNYIGPINGHNISKLITTLKKIKNFKGPLLLHIKTKKGYGYAPAEKDPITWHFIPKFNAITKKLPKKKNKTTYSKIFGDWLCYVASKDKKLIAITPAMSEGSGMKKFSQQYPKQYFDVAIAEQHAVTFAAGLAISGYKPVVAIYSTFLQRAYDQVIHDIAIQKLPVLLAIDRGGVVGSDGQTHQGAFDLSYLRCIPNILIMTPSSENECKLMLHTGYNYKYGPSAVRYPKGEVNHLEIHNIHYNQLYNLPLGKGVICRKGENIAILNFGTLLEEAKQAACNLNATLVDMRFVKPLDEDLLNKLTKNHQALITLEENSVLGGAGSGVNEFLMREKILIPVLNLGLPDFFIPQGSQKEIRSDLKLDGVGIFEQITKWISN